MSLFQSLESFAPKKDPMFFKDLTEHARKAMSVVRARVTSSSAIEAAGDTRELLTQLKFTSGVEKIIHTHTGLTVSVKLAPLKVGLDYTCGWKYSSKELNALMRQKRKSLSPSEVAAISPSALGKFLKHLPNNTYSGRVSEDAKQIMSSVINIPAWAFQLDKVSEQLAPLRDDPEVIAAAILHEVGHLLFDFGQFSGIIEHSDTVDYVVSLLDTQIPNVPEVTSALKAAIPTIEALTQTDETKALVAAIHRLLQDLKTDTDTTTLDVAIYILRQVAYLLYATSLVGPSNSINDGGVFHSTEAERHADEYASQCGAGAALARMLAGINKTERLFDRSQVFTLQSTTMFVSSRFEAFKAAFDISPNLVVDVYDPIEKRLQLLCANVQRGAADKDLSVEQREFYLEVLSETDEVVKEYSATKFVAMRNILYGLYKTLALVGVAKMLPALYAQLSHGRQMQDYIQHLFKSPMHSYTGRLGSIASAR